LRHLESAVQVRPVWQGVSTDSLKFHPGPPCPTFLRPAGGPPPETALRPFLGGPPAGRAACGRLLLPWIPHAVRVWSRCNVGCIDDWQSVGRRAKAEVIASRDVIGGPILLAPAAVTECDALQNFTHGQIDCSNGFSLGSICSFKCDQGFYRFGSEDFITCQASATVRQTMLRNNIKGSQRP
jgi:hypothetical protein